MTTKRRSGISLKSRFHQKPNNFQGVVAWHRGRLLLQKKIQFLLLNNEAAAIGAVSAVFLNRIEKIKGNDDGNWLHSISIKSIG